VRQPFAENIVNPAKLAGAARDSVCERCHLEGETRTLNPGRTIWDYHPGEALERSIVTWLLHKPNPEIRAVTQAEELAESKCAQASARKHFAQRTDGPRVFFLPRGTLQQASRRAPRLHHLPHARPARQQHRAPRSRRPSASSARPYSGPETLVAWREPPPEFRQRDLALAQLQTPSLASKSMKLLETLPEAQQPTIQMFFRRWRRPSPKQARRPRR
jgi:hypothetical protein